MSRGGGCSQLQAKVLGEGPAVTAERERAPGLHSREGHTSPFTLVRRSGGGASHTYGGQSQLVQIAQLRGGLEEGPFLLIFPFSAFFPPHSLGPSPSLLPLPSVFSDLALLPPFLHSSPSLTLFLSSQPLPRSPSPLSYLSHPKPLFPPP